MKIGVLQFAPEFGEIKKNLHAVEELASQSDDIDILVLPELFSTGYQFKDRGEVQSLSQNIPQGETIRFLEDLASTRQMYIVAGMAEKDGDRVFNSAVLVGPDGFECKYRKAHLFDTEKRWFSPGDTPFIVHETGAARVGLMICFDWFFPEVSRILALKGADILCHPSNLVLPYCQDAMITRCLENRIYAATANRTGTENRGRGKPLSFTGMSQIVSPAGEILIRMEKYDEGIGIADIDLFAGRNKNITEGNNLFSDRRIDLYSSLLSPPG